MGFPLTAHYILKVEVSIQHCWWFEPFFFWLPVAAVYHSKHINHIHSISTIFRQSAYSHLSLKKCRPKATGLSLLVFNAWVVQGCFRIAQHMINIAGIGITGQPNVLWNIICNKLLQASAQTLELQLCEDMLLQDQVHNDYTLWYTCKWPSLSQYGSIWINMVSIWTVYSIWTRGVLIENHIVNRIEPYWPILNRIEMT